MVVDVSDNVEIVVGATVVEVVTDSVVGGTIVEATVVVVSVGAGVVLKKNFLSQFCLSFE